MQVHRSEPRRFSSQSPRSNFEIRRARIGERAVAAGAAIVAAAVPALCQSASYKFVNSSSSTWPTAIPHPSHVTRTGSGEFDGFGRRDAILLADGRPIFVHDAAYYGAMQPIALTDGTCNDFDVAPGRGISGPDGIACVESTGLYFYGFDWAFGEFTLQTDYSITSAAWQGAKLVRCADVNADGLLDYVGVAADSSTIILQRSSGSTYTQSLVATGGGITDILPLQFDSDNPLEIAVLDNAGLQIVDGVSIPLTFARNSGVTIFNDAIDKVTSNDGAPQKIAWVRNRAAPDQAKQELVLVKRAGTNILFQYNVNLNSPVFSVVGADSSAMGQGDGDTDLVMANKDLYLPLISENNSPASYFSNAVTYQQAFVTGLDVGQIFNAPPPGNNTPLAPDNEARPVYADFNQDGRPDLLLYVQGRHSLYMFESQPINIHALIGSELSHRAGVRHDSAGNVWLEMAFYAETASSTIENVYPPVPGAYRYYLNLRLFKQTGPTALNSPIQAMNSYSLEMYTPAANASMQTVVDGGGAQHSVVKFRVKLASGQLPNNYCLSDLYWVEMSWYAEQQTTSYPHPIMQGANYFFYLSEVEGDALTVWTPCYSYLPPYTSVRDPSGVVMDIDDGSNTSVCDSNDFYYASANCPSGTTLPVLLPTVGTRRKIRFPETNGTTILPPPPPGPTDDCEWVSTPWGWVL